MKLVHSVLSFPVCAATLFALPPACPAQDTSFEVTITLLMTALVSGAQSLQPADRAVMEQPRQGATHGPGDDTITLCEYGSTYHRHGWSATALVMKGTIVI